MKTAVSIEVRLNFSITPCRLHAVAFPTYAHKRIDSDDVHAPADTAPAFVEGELIVKVKPGGSPHDAADSVDADILRPIGDGSMHVLKLRFGSVQDAVRTCGGRTDVAFVEPNWMRQPHLLPNDGLGKVSYPAAFSQAIAVGSTDWHDVPAPYSNYGSGLDVVAPGGNMARLHDPRGIYSCMPTYPVTMTAQHGYNMWYDQLQGTSMAAPQVTGLVAFKIDSLPAFC